MQAIQNIQMQLQNLSQSITQDKDRRQMVDRLLAEAEALPPHSASHACHGAAGSPDAEPSVPAAQQLEDARAQLRALELRLKPTHPDLARMKRVIARLEQKAEAEALEQPLSPSDRRRFRPTHRSCNGRRGFGISPQNATPCRAGLPQRKRRR